MENKIIIESDLFESLNNAEKTILLNAIEKNCHLVGFELKEYKFDGLSNDYYIMKNYDNYDIEVYPSSDIELYSKFTVLENVGYNYMVEVVRYEKIKYISDKTLDIECSLSEHLFASKNEALEFIEERLKYITQYDTTGFILYEWYNDNQTFQYIKEYTYYTGI